MSFSGPLLIRTSCERTLRPKSTRWGEDLEQIRFEGCTGHVEEATGALRILLETLIPKP